MQYRPSPANTLKYSNTRNTLYNTVLIKCKRLPVTLQPSRIPLQHGGQPPQSVAGSSTSQTLVVIVHFIACVAQQQDTQSHFE